MVNTQDVNIRGGHVKLRYHAEPSMHKVLLSK
jgi:hypothetical protein